MKTTAAQQPKRSGRIIITLIQPVMVYKLSQEQTYLLSIHIILYIAFPRRAQWCRVLHLQNNYLCKNTTLAKYQKMFVVLSNVRQCHAAVSLCRSLVTYLDFYY
jgi:NADH:ubiquinone oxidoreductase subunit D